MRTTSGEAVRPDKHSLFWIATVMMGLPAGRLAFHLQTHTIPNSALSLSPLSVALGVLIAAIAIRGERGLVRIGLTLFALSFFVPVVASIGVVGWGAWAVDAALLWTASSLLIVDLRRSVHVRVTVVVAAMLMVVALSYGAQRIGYDTWMRATKQS